jgi:ssDNA-binding replication factor A large subunit
MAESPMDRYVELILRQRSDLGRDEILSLIEEKKRKATVSEKYKGVWAALMVAHELGVKFEQDISDSDLLISELTAGMSSVTVKARIISIFPPKEFQSEGKMGGRFIKLLIGDQSGWATLMIWRDKVDLVESQALKPNDLVRVKKAYCKEGRLGRPELHIGQSGVITRLDGDEGGEIPPREGFYAKPSQLTSEQQVVNVMGSIIGISPVTEFRRFDGTSGKVRRVILGDEKANVTGSLWNEQADELSEEDVGRTLYVDLARMRPGRMGDMEFVVDRASQVKAGERRPGGAESFTPIAQLDQREGMVNVYARVSRAFPPKTVRITGLGDRRAREVLLYDNTGYMTLTIWGERDFPALIEGERVIIRNAKIRHTEQGPSLTMGALGNVEPAQGDMSPIDEPRAMIQRLGELKAGMRNAMVEGLISKQVEVGEVTTSSGENVTRAVTTLADDTGEVQVVAWREAVEKLADLQPGSVVRLRWVTVRTNAFDGKLGVVVTSNTEVEVQK